MSGDDIFLSFYHMPLLLSLSLVTAISLCNAMQEQPTCWASNVDYTDSQLSNLSFAGLFETQSTNLAFNTSGTTKFEVTLRDSYTDSQSSLHSLSLNIEGCLSFFIPPCKNFNSM